jgi:hypothetical protein
MHVTWWLLPIGIALGLVAVVVCALALWVLGTHLRWSLFHRRAGKQVVLGALPTLALWTGELGALLTLTWWRVTGLGDGGFSSSQTKNRGRPVVCVHGMWGNGTNMRRIRAALEARGRPSYSVDLGRPFRGIEDYGPPLALALHQALALHPEGDGLDVVCHSMGGVVLRVVLAADPELAAAVRTVVTISSPHQGTHLAVGIGAFVPEAPSLARGSAWIGALPPLSTSCPQARVVAVVASHDSIVYPEETCRIEGCEVHVLQGTGHAGTLTKREAVDVVVQALQGRRMDAAQAER